MSAALETTQLGKRYGRVWGLQNCSLALPAGRVAALVGPNGAGKTTLLHLTAGLLPPTTGRARVFGLDPRHQAREVLPRIGFVAQDHPLYRDLSVNDLLTLGRKMNPRWDDALARNRLQWLGIPPHQRVGRLSGGQQAQVALVLALAKRPDLLLLDEPLASLDPLARREFLRTLMDAVVEAGVTVLLSSHIIGDLERVCDYLIILSASQVQVAGDVQELMRTHKRLVGPRQGVAAIASIHTVVESSQTERQTTLLVWAAVPSSIPRGRSRRCHWRISFWPIWARGPARGHQHRYRLRGKHTKWSGSNDLGDLASASHREPRQRRRAGPGSTAPVTRKPEPNRRLVQQSK